jgi:GNAT superfamily N-acetyltransferase
VATGALAEEAPLVVAVAAHDEEPVGLAAVAPAPSPAVLRALAVAPAHRGQGLGTDLLRHAERLGRQAGAGRLVAEYRGDLTERAALERVLQKRGWSAPQAHRHLCKAVVADVVAQAALPARPSLKEGAVVAWADATAAERRRMQAQAHDDEALPDACAPFQRPEAVEPACSLILRGPEELQGWLVAHRLDDDIVQYTSLYVAPHVRRAGRALSLVVAAARRQHDRTGAGTALWTVRTDNAPMTAFQEEHLAPLLASRDTRWRTAKSVAQGGGDKRGEGAGGQRQSSAS